MCKFLPFNGNFSSQNRLDTIRYFDNFDSRENPRHTKVLGKFIIKVKMLNDSLVVYSQLTNENYHISIFTANREVYSIEPHVEHVDISNFSFIEKTGELLLLSSSYTDGK